MRQSVTVIGAGSWGTTLAVLLSHNFNPGQVSLFCRSAGQADQINSTGLNPLYFPEVQLPINVKAFSNLEQALEGSSTAYLVVPTTFLRDFIDSERDELVAFAEADTVLCNCSKGLLLNPSQRTDEWLLDTLPGVTLTHLAGPNLAGEIIEGQPAAAVVAGPEAAAAKVQAELMTERFRVYTATDTVGLEVAGFYKNIIAIAAGALTELGMGLNARSMLITRGLAEMGRLVDYFGGDPAVLSGLAGIGDLIATCSSEKSRNFRTGMLLARGESLSNIGDDMQQVAEGVQASAALHNWPADHPGIVGWPDLPIARQVYRFVHEGADPREALSLLMQRPPKAE